MDGAREAKTNPVSDVTRRRFLEMGLGFAVAPAWAGNALALEQASNQVVILIDGSASYRERQVEAVERAKTLLDGMTQAKTRRWEPAADQVAIVSLDALPGVLWQGTLEDLKAMDRKAWAERFKARSDYAGCTDVSAAFRLAARHLDGDPRLTDKYLWAFTDLIHEPPTSSVRACQKRTFPSPPPPDFPWDVLEGVAVSIFWVPPDQVLVWRRLVEQKGLGATFALYTTSESGAVPIAPPPKATVNETKEEAAAERREMTRRIRGWARLAGLGLSAFAGAVALLFAAQAAFRWRGRRQREARIPVPTAGGAGHASARRSMAAAPGSAPRAAGPGLGRGPAYPPPPGNGRP